MKWPISIVVMVVLSVLAVFTCIKIEVLNARAGNVLPRDVPTQGNPKWREPSVMSLRKVHELNYRLQNNLTFEESIPDAGIAEIAKLVERDSPRIVAESRLISVLGSWGLFQYLLCPLVGLWGLLVSVEKSKQTKAICLCVSFVGFSCWFMAFYRSYFGSLGW